MAFVDLVREIVQRPHPGTPIRGQVKIPARSEVEVSCLNCEWGVWIMGAIWMTQCDLNDHLPRSRQGSRSREMRRFGDFLDDEDGSEAYLGITTGLMMPCLVNTRWSIRSGRNENLRALEDLTVLIRDGLSLACVRWKSGRVTSCTLMNLGLANLHVCSVA